MDNGSITYFDITACGFYRLKHKSDQSDYKFGDLIGVLDDLESWLADKSFEQTLAWDKEEVVAAYFDTDFAKELNDSSIPSLY